MIDIDTRTVLISAWVLVNMTMVGVLAFFIFCVIYFKDFRKWVVNLVEDGDQVPNKKDAYDAVILFFATITGWCLVNLIFYDVLNEQDFLGLIIAVSTIMGGLFGITALSKK